MPRVIPAVVVGGLCWWLAATVTTPAQEKGPDKGEVKADGLPARALARLGTGKFRQGSRILCLAYSPNGRILAAGGGDDPIRLWDVDEGKLLRTLPEAWVNAMVFSPRGSVVVTAGAFKTIRMWETTTGKEVNKLDGHKSAVKALAISPDGTLLASGDAQGDVVLWELLTARVVTTFKGHTDEITCLAFSPDSSRLASGSGDRTIRLWDVDNGKFVRDIDGGCMLGAVAFATEKTLLSGGDDNLIRTWDVDSGKQLEAWKGHEGNIGSLQVIRDKKTQQPLTLVSGAHDGTIRLWSLTDKKEPQVIRRSLGDSDALALTKNGDFIATGGVNNAIRVFETATLKELDFGPGHKAGIHALAKSPDGKMLASVSVMGEVIVWDPRTGRVIKSWNCPRGGEMIAAFSPDSGTLATAVGVDGVRLWNPADGSEKAHLPTDAGDPVLSLAYVPGGQTLIVGRRSGSVDLFDVKERKASRTLKYAGPAYALGVSRDGKTLAVSGSNKVTLWNLEDGRELKSFGSREEGPPTSWPLVAALAFHPDGNVLAISCYDGVIRFMDLDEKNFGKELKTCEGHTSVAYGISFATDGRTLASAGFDRTIRIWESFSGQQVAQLKGHHGPGMAVAFAADGRSLFSGSADTTILHWDATGVGASVPVVKLAVPEMQSMWLDLASEETARAHGVLWRFVGGGKDSINYIESSLYLVDPKHIDQLFEDLKSEVYKTREKATAELEKYGRWMEGRLQDAVKKPNSLEVQRRLERLLGKLGVPGSLTLNQERLRIRRTMMIMEQIGDENALRVLEKLSRGAPEVPVQQEAAASVARLKARGK